MAICGSRERARMAPGIVRGEMQMKWTLVAALLAACLAGAGEPFDPNAYLPAVTADYSTADGKMLSLPFNSSTAITYRNKDALKKAGLDPDKALSTWPDTLSAAQKLRAAGIPCGLIAGWITWTQIEQFSAWHSIPLATSRTGSKVPMPSSNSTIRSV